MTLPGFPLLETAMVKYKLQKGKLVIKDEVTVDIPDGVNVANGTVVVSTSDSKEEVVTGAYSFNDPVGQDGYFVIPQSAKLQSVVVSIIVEVNGTEVERPMLPEPVRLDFNISLRETVRESCLVYSCEFWDEANKRYSSAGCETQFDRKSNEVECICHHLTDFALLEYNRLSMQCAQDGTLNAVLITFAIGFFIVGVLSGVQFFRSIVGVKDQYRNNFTSAQHFALMTLAFLRVIVLFGFSMELDLGEVGLTIFTALPHCVDVGIFSVLIFQWSSIVKADSNSKFQGFDMKVVGLNAVASVLILLIFLIPVVTGNSDNPRATRFIPSLIMSFVWLGIAAGFCYHAQKVARLIKGVETLSAASTNSSTASNSEQSSHSLTTSKVTTSKMTTNPRGTKTVAFGKKGMKTETQKEVITRLTCSGYLVMLCVVLDVSLSTAALAAGAFDLDTLIALNIAYYLADAVVIIVVLNLYRSAVRGMRFKSEFESKQAVRKNSMDDIAQMQID